MELPSLTTWGFAAVIALAAGILFSEEFFFSSSLLLLSLFIALAGQVRPASKKKKLDPHQLDDVPQSSHHYGHGHDDHHDGHGHDAGHDDGHDDGDHDGGH